jgi:hypothetical protein
MGAERVISRNLIYFKPDFGLEPYSLLIHESNGGERDITHKSSQMSDVVEPLLAGCSQNSKAVKTFEAGAFVFWQGRLHRRLPTKLEEFRLGTRN